MALKLDNVDECLLSLGKVLETTFSNYERNQEMYLDDFKKKTSVLPMSIQFSWLQTQVRSIATQTNSHKTSKSSYAKNQIQISHFHIQKFIGMYLKFLS